MKRVLAALSTAVAVAGCHITVVPAPMAPTSSTQSSAEDSTRGVGPKVVVAVVDARDSVPIIPRRRTVPPTDSVDGAVDPRDGVAHRPPATRRPNDDGERTEVPPRLAKHDGVPPGLAKKDSMPPGLAKHDGVPPGLAKKDSVPAGLARHDGVPPGLAKKDSVPAGLARHDGVPPGQARKDDPSKTPEHLKPEDAGQSGVASGTRHPGIPGPEKRLDRGEHGRADQAGNPDQSGRDNPAHPNDKVDKTDQSAEHGNEAKADRATGKDHSDAKAGRAGGADPGVKASQVAGRGDREKSATPGKGTSEDDAKPDNETQTDQSAEPAKGVRTAQTAAHGKGAQSEQTAEHGKADKIDQATEHGNEEKADGAIGKAGDETADGVGRETERQTNQTESTPPATAVTIAELLASDTLVGQEVRVTGTCLSTKQQSAAGGAPVGKDDWQLGAEGDAIWVTGARPEGCTSSGGREETDATVVAKVSQDQPPARGKKAAVPRRYLVVE